MPNHELKNQKNPKRKKGIMDRTKSEEIEKSLNNNDSAREFEVVKDFKKQCESSNDSSGQGWPETERTRRYT